MKIKELFNLLESISGQKPNTFKFSLPSLSDHQDTKQLDSFVEELKAKVLKDLEEDPPDERDLDYKKQRAKDIKDKAEGMSFLDILDELYMSLYTDTYLTQSGGLFSTSNSEDFLVWYESLKEKDHAR